MLSELNWLETFYLSMWGFIIGALLGAAVRAFSDRGSDD